MAPVAAVPGVEPPVGDVYRRVYGAGQRPGEHYELSTLVPEEFKGSLPTIEEIESEITAPEVIFGANVYADAIKARRAEIGMTQQELADICKMPQPSIARIESGDSSPNLSTLLKICEALGLKIKIES